jgi:2-polyprenyl-3-methyl-5-hydroxy-6-metoxy-1,4-benzoquinol methylase
MGSSRGSRKSSNHAKYESGNPAQIVLIKRFQERVTSLLKLRPFKTVLDVGCGEGFLARCILDAFPGTELFGIDLSPSAVEHARARCPEARFESKSFEELAKDEKRYDLVVCSEVLEHLSDPAAAIDVLAARCGGTALLTVPWEPWFQLANFARGKYLKNLGNHPEHIQHWGVESFAREASRRFDTLYTETSFPWILYIGAPRA